MAELATVAALPAALPALAALLGLRALVESESLLMGAVAS
jgi:hypothetical protein